jgi:4-aminobutyrate aminotransferase-like enzyme
MSALGVGDDCDNNWGRQYLRVLQSRNSGSSTRFSGDVTDTEINNLIRSYTNYQFELAKICITGSEATHYATLLMNFHKNGTVAYGIGSYAVGRNSLFQEMTTVKLEVGARLVEITDPESDYVTAKAKDVAIPLPYYIGEENSDEEYDKECLTFIEHQCKMFKIMQKPLVCIVMELMLAGNGAILSTFFLEKFGKLGRKYGFYAIVDEIFTGGRACHDNMFLTFSK